MIDPSQQDFELSGLKVASVIRVARLAVVAADVLMGAIGEISVERLRRIKQNLAKWILSS